MGQIEIKWEALEYEDIHRSNDWFWGVGLVGIAATAAAIILGNVLFGIFIFIGTLALILQAIRKPRKLRCAITDRGIVLDKTIYPYSTLESFWITEEEWPKLLLKSEKFFMPLISIPLDNAPIDEIRDILFNFIEEEELHEPLSQKIMERLGF